MHRVERIRKSIDGALDRWQVRADAMEAQLNATQDKVIERVEEGKRAYLHAIDAAKTTVAKSKTLAEQEKRRLQTRFDEARVQFALGKADTADALAKQHATLRRDLAKLEKDVDTELAAFDNAVDESLDEVALDLVKAGDVLDAEMDAAAAQLAAVKDKASANFDAKAVEIRQDLSAFRARIDDSRGDASASLQAFESEFDEGWRHIKSAFKNLM